MKVQVHYKRFKQIHQLVQRRQAQSPQQLAKHLSVSIAYVYIYLKMFKDFGAPIAYCRKKKYYYYTNPNFRWEDLNF